MLCAGVTVYTRLDLQESLDFAAQGKVRATVSTEALENVNDVFARMHKGGSTAEWSWIWERDECGTSGPSPFPLEPLPAHARHLLAHGLLGDVLDRTVRPGFDLGQPTTQSPQDAIARRRRHVCVDHSVHRFLLDG